MRNAIVALKARREMRGQHAGLLLQRYLCENATGDGGNPKEKRAILQAAINAAKNDDVRSLYQGAFERWISALPDKSKSVELATDGRLIVGLGSENVLETGITLHHTYGMPMIPGSALKGLAAHYCDQVWGSGDAAFKKPSTAADAVYRKHLRNDGPRPDDNYHRLLFGNTDDSGCVIFHDAWYVPDSDSQPLRLDVMTPHHPKWLDGSAPPTDFDSPTPVPFLSVTGRFRIALSWRGPDCGESGKWLELALALITQALAEWGIGGKTSSGYGRLVDPKSTKHSETAPTAMPAQLPRAGDKVEALLLEEKTKKGGWKAKHGPTGLAGPIQNSAEVPADKNAGDPVKLIVAFANTARIAFRYPTAADEQRAQKKKQANVDQGHKGSKRGRR